MKIIILLIASNLLAVSLGDVASPNIVYGEGLVMQEEESSFKGEVMMVEQYGVKTDNALKFVKQSFQNGKELFTKLKSSNFVDSITKTAKWGLPLLKSIGFFAQFVKGFMQTESKELAYMKEQFAIINNKMDSLELEFGDMKRLIDWNNVKVNIGAYERSIRLMSEKLNLVIDSPEGPVKDIMISEFNLYYQRSYREAAGKLYESTVNDKLIFSDNLILAIRKYTKEYRSKIQQFLVGLLTLIMKGAQIEISYLTFAHLDTGIDHWSAVWESRIKELEKRFLETDRLVESKWHDQAEKDIEEFNAENHGLSNEQYNAQLYNFLNDKFPNRQWFTLVYNALSGGDKHYVFACGGFIRFRARGKNVVIGSAGREHTQFSNTDASSLLNSIPSVYHGMPDRAHYLLINQILPRTSQNCQKYAMAAVVGYGENVWYAGPASRRAYRHFEGYQWSGAGRTYRRRTMNFNVMIFG